MTHYFVGVPFVVVVRSSSLVHLWPHFHLGRPLYIIEVGEEGVRWVLASRCEARNLFRKRRGSREIGHGRRKKESNLSRFRRFDQHCHVV